MADSAIEWTDKTWNPVAGCTRVSAGCDSCYAVTMTHRLEAMGQAKYAGLTVLNGKGDRHFNGQVRCDEAALKIPLCWKKPKRVFVNSMSDLFHKDVPFEFVDKVFAVMALCPQHTFQILTKRPERMAEYLTCSREMVSYWMGRFVGKKTMKSIGEAFDMQAWYALGKPLPNVWLGCSVENQDAADKRIPELLKCPAAVRFLSVEPLLGPVDLSAFFGGEYATASGSEPNYNFGIDWCIVGGESGPGARPCNVEWIRSVVAQCKAAGTACFVKQLGSVPVIWDVGAGDEFSPDAPGFCQLGFKGRPLTDRKGGDISEFPADLRVRQFPQSIKAADAARH